MSRFFPLFLLYMGLIVTLSFRLEGFEKFADFLGQQTASLSYWFLSGFSAGAEVVGKTVSFNGFKMIVIGECAALLPIMMFAAAVIAFPARWGSKLIGLLLGIPVLFGFNVFRIMGLLIVGKYEPTLFHFAHIYVWQGSMILMIGGLWLSWVLFVVQGNDRAPLRS